MIKGRSGRFITGKLNGAHLHCVIEDGVEAPMIKPINFNNCFELPPHHFLGIKETTRTGIDKYLERFSITNNLL